MSHFDTFIKRLFDCMASLNGLLVLWPLYIFTAILILADSPGGVFFCQTRIGRFGRPFTLIKFRTMHVGDPKGNAVTVRGDPRITKVGRWLRRFKIDELPQLFNVLRGEMSLVGPRPDVSGFADRLSGEDAAILSIRPGITGPASIFFRDEEALLAETQKCQQFNDTIIWPQKIAINRRYLAEWSFFNDLKYIFVTVFPPLEALLFVQKKRILCPNRSNKAENFK